MHHSQITILHCTIKIIRLFHHSAPLSHHGGHLYLPCGPLFYHNSPPFHNTPLSHHDVHFPSQYLVFHQIFCWPISVSHFPSICTIFSPQCTSVPHSDPLCHHDVLLPHHNYLMFNNYISHCPTGPKCIIPMLHCPSILLCLIRILHSSTTKLYCPLTMPHCAFTMLLSSRSSTVLLQCSILPSQFSTVPLRCFLSLTMLHAQSKLSPVSFKCSIIPSQCHFLSCYGTYLYLLYGPLFHYSRPLSHLNIHLLCSIFSLQCLTVPSHYPIYYPCEPLLL